MNALGRFCRIGIAGLLLIYAIDVAMALCRDASSSGLQKTDALRRDGESHFVSIGGLRLQYVDWGGKGKTLIFIPGGCDTAFVFGDVASRLAQHFRVLGLTARGCGASDRPAGGYDMSHQLGDVLGFMNALHVQRCILIGHSSGGGKITQFAHKYPDRVDRLVYLNTVYGYIAPGLEEKINEQIQKMLGGDPMDSVENWKRSGRIWEPGVHSAAMDRDFAENFIVEGDGKIKERYDMVPAWRKEVDPDMNAGLYTDTHISHPALMIFAMDSDDDRIKQFPPEARRDLEALARQTEGRRRDEIERFRSNGDNVQIVELRHTAHYCFVQRPATVSRLIAQFLARPVS